MNHERDQLLARLRELREQAQDLVDQTNEILDQEHPQHRWTPVVIRGGLAGAAIGWLAGLARGAWNHHPVTTATVALATTGAALGVLLAPDGPDPHRAIPSPSQPPITHTPTAESSIPTATTTAAPPLTTTTTTAAPPAGTLAPAQPGASSTTRPPTTTTADTTTTTTTTTTSSPPPPDEMRARCFLRVDLEPVADLCVFKRADRLRASRNLAVT